MNRSDYIGSSDARHILNGDWSRLYAQKLRLETPQPPSFAMRLGMCVEALHLDETITALNVETSGGFKYSTNAGRPDQQHFARYIYGDGFNAPTLGSHPDALLRDLAGTVYPLEVKLTARWRSIEEAADWYMPQLQHHMLCWGVDQCLFSVILGTSEPQRMWVGASHQWQNHYLERCDTFWGHVKSEIPPAPLLPHDSRAPKVPAEIKDSVPLDGMTRRDMGGNNRFKAVALEYIDTKEAVARHDKAKRDLKSMMHDDERELYSDMLTLKRDKRGAIRFTVHEQEQD